MFLPKMYPQPKIRASSSRGMTLLELVAAVAIICILTSLLFPLGASLSERVKVTQCVGNLRSIGYGLASYAAEHDGKIPRCSPFGEGCGWQDGFGIVNTLYPAYIDDRKVFACPATTLNSMKAESLMQNVGFPHADISYYYRYHTDQLNDLFRIGTAGKNYAVVGDMYIKDDGTRFDFVNHVKRKVYNGLFLDGHVETLQGPLSGYAGVYPGDIDSGEFWNALERGGAKPSSR